MSIVTSLNKQKGIIVRFFVPAACAFLTIVCLNFHLTIDLAHADGSDVVLESYRKTLKDNGLEPNTNGALGYLRSLPLEKNQHDEINAIIQQLGDNDFTVREAALQKLMTLPAPNELLLNAAESDDPEIRWRSQLVLANSEDRMATLLLATLKIVTAEPGETTISDLLPALRWCRQHRLQRSGRDALMSVAQPTDVPQLFELLKSDDETTQVATMYVLVDKLDASRRGELHHWLENENPNIALAATEALANVGERATLKPMVGFLAHQDPKVRLKAIGLLRSFTGEYMKFAPYGNSDERAKGVKQWNDWLAANGSTAELLFPLRMHHTGRGDLAGNTLIATGGRGEVVELDPSGHKVWSYSANSWSAEKMPNGNVLIASYGSNLVVEVNSAGKVVWEMKGINAMTAKPLANGNFLIADFGGQRVIEVNRTKEVVWEHKTPANCFDSDRLPNGNTIFGCPNVVGIVTPEKRLVNEIKISGRLNGIHPLPTGNILVANYGEGKVVELTPEGREIWVIKEAGACDVFQLPDGTLLISSSARVTEYGPDHKLRRKLYDASYGSARR